VRRTGTLVVRELGGSKTWILEGPEGPHELKGAVDASLLGRRVTVHGELAEAQFGFSMSGPVIDVRRMEASP
jgi:hypothetical protein